MTDIQRARGVLATWRERATEGPWKVVDGVYSQEGMTYDGSQIEAEYEMVAMDHQDLDCGPVAPLGYSDARLIVLTAGNPDLLDAIDRLLGHTAILSQMSHFEMSTYGQLCTKLAAAILDADERMQQ